MIWLYSVLGFGGIGAVIWLYLEIKKIGAADLKLDVIEKERDNARHDAEILKKQRDIANATDPSIDDVLGRMSKNDL